MALEASSTLYCTPSLMILLLPEGIALLSRPPLQSFLRMTSAAGFKCGDFLCDSLGEPLQECGQMPHPSTSIFTLGGSLQS